MTVDIHFAGSGPSLDARSKIIGVIGGVGPMSGLDLAAKILVNTEAGTDQEHLPLLLASLPEAIPDRTAFLLGGGLNNPGIILADIARNLYQAGARVLGIPCNTAHAAPIFNLLEQQAAELPGVVLVNMLEETCREIRDLMTAESRAAVLSTLGTYRCRVYDHYLNQLGLTAFDPGPEIIERVHAAIYHPGYGLKSRSAPVTVQARSELTEVVKLLKLKGVTLAVLGCTELPLALTGESCHEVRLVDPTTCLARAMIRKASPEKLKVI